MASPEQSPLREEQENLDPRSRSPGLDESLNQKQPQLPQTLTPEAPDLPKPQTIPTTDQPDQGQTLDPHARQDPEGMSLSPSQALAKNPQIGVRSVVSESRPAASLRKPWIKRKKAIAPKRRRAIEEKVRILTENFRPIRFVPRKNSGFSKHEELLKRLNLWDFVHLEFDKDVRTDLLIQLVGKFNHGMRCSYVNDKRINITKPMLARALKLPVKKEKASVPEAGEGDAEVLSGETVSFFEDLLSNWVLLHDDMWMMPSEVVAWTKLVKEGHPGKVDWAGLMWFMVEKELMQGSQLVHCYYASHLQCLIKSQKESVFDEEPVEIVRLKDKGDGGDGGKVKVDSLDEEEEVVGVKVEEDATVEEEKAIGVKVEADVKDEEEEVTGTKVEDNAKDVEEEALGVNLEVDVRVKEEEGVGNKVETSIEEKGVGNKVESDMEEEGEVFGSVQAALDLKEEEGDGGDARVADLDNLQSCEMEEQNLQLTLGQDNVEKEEGRDNDIMDFEESKEEEPGQWFLNGNEQYLQRCNLVEVKGLDYGNGREGEVVEDDRGEGKGGEEGTFTPVPNCNVLDALPSDNLIPAVDGERIPYSSTGQLQDDSSGGLLASAADAHRVSAGPSIFSNINKRVSDEDNDISLHSLNGNHKRLKIGPWDDKSTDFLSCLEHAQQWMERAKIMYEAKEQACAESNMNQQFLLNELRQRDGMIEHLHKTKYEELQIKQMEIYKHDRELREMYNLLQGYKKALNERSRAFDEYRRRCPELDEPLYMDVPGGGGLVLSTMEIEKQRLKQEEEEETGKRVVIENMIREFEADWNQKLEAHLTVVNKLFSEVEGCMENVTLLKELRTKSKISDLPECPSEDTISEVEGCMENVTLLKELGTKSEISDLPECPSEDI